MDIEILEHFVVFAKSLNVTNAAAVLYLTQPTLSRQLYALEKEIGTKLFFIENHHFRLTEAGAVLYNEGKELIDQYNAVLSKVTETVRSQNKENIAIETHTTFIEPLFDLCQSYKRIRPQVSYSFECKTMQEIIDDVLIGQCALGCITSIALEQYDSKVLGLGKYAIGRDALCFIVGKNTPLGKKGWTTWTEIRGEIENGSLKLLQHNGSDGYNFFNKIFKKENLPFLPERNTLQNSPTMLYELRSTNSIYPSFESVFGTMENYCSMVTVTGKEYFCNVMLIWRLDNQNPLIRDFLENTEAIIKDFQ
jgi:DNA-binding transcriptional LysR family regulator